ncbi:MAG: helix-turn-helix transcriptional regulator [Lachnospiraceae bacterium]|nr:helix-turn-helix transcriptional regulator [Lachnospiraceae bacterium]
MINLIQKTPNELNNGIATRLVQIRKRRRISQKLLAEKSGVSLGSLKRFEQTGEISLHSLSKLAIALGVEDELESLFNRVEFTSIEEIIRGQS